MLAGGVLGAAVVLLPDEPADVPVLGAVAVLEPLWLVLGALTGEELPLAGVLADVAELGVLAEVVSELPADVLVLCVVSPVPAVAVLAVPLLVVSLAVLAGVDGTVVAAGVETGFGLVISERLVLIPSGAPGGRTPLGLPPETGGLVDEIGGDVIFATGGVVCLGVEDRLEGLGVDAVVLALGFLTGL